MNHEIDDHIQASCRGCLSTGRKLTPVRNHKDLLCEYLLEYLYQTSSYSNGIQVCWECIAHLRKASQFLQQVRKANELIQHGQNYVFGSLSSLSTVIINDTHPSVVYFNESNTKNENCEHNNVHNDESNDSTANSDHAQTNDEIKGPECDFKVESIAKSDVKDGKNNETDKINVQNELKVKVKYKNKWAETKALLNKSPKFKILTKEELVTNKYFRRVQLDLEIVKKYLERERDGGSFRKSCFKCDSCATVFKSKKLMLKHDEKFHTETIGAYICDICSSRMQRKSDLKRHIKRHTIRYECSFCGFSCRSKDDRTTHLRNHKQVFQCLKCELIYSSRQEFNKHHKDWHEKFICEHCGVSFKMRYCIENHIKKQHSTFECAPCQKRFARYSGLWLHNKLCHSNSDGAPAAPAYCVECDKRFVDVYRYKWHLYNSVRHTAKKKIKVPCPDCGKEFSKNIYMKDHYNLVHLKKFKYRCEDCDKNFVRNADLMKHKRRIHEGIQPPKNKICYVCGRGFTTNAILLHHLRTHSADRHRKQDAT